jgi:uncharacterized membrane protein YqjE
MEESAFGLGQITASTKHFAQGLFTIGENRLELLAVEMQEARERLLHAIILALGVAVFGLLALMTLTAAIVFLLWAWSPAAVLLIVTALYGGAGFYVWRRLSEMLRTWETLPATLDQLRKDGECLKKVLA